MKIGTALIVIMLVLIGFGFLVSQELNTRAELKNAHLQLEQLQKDLSFVQSLYDTTKIENEELKSEVDRLTNQNLTLHAQVGENMAKNQVLNNLNARLQAENSFLKGKTPWTMKLLSELTASTLFAIATPIIPISLGTIYIVARASGKFIPKRRTYRDNHSERIMQINVTESEMRHILSLRRGR